jgi:hypothetical protein
VAIDSSVNYIVTEYEADRLSKVTPDGAWSMIYQLPSHSWPTGLTIDSSGNYIVAEFSADILSKVTPAGVMTFAYNFTAGAGSGDVACTTITYTPHLIELYSATMTWIIIGIVPIIAVVVILVIYFLKRKR